MNKLSTYFLIGKTLVTHKRILLTICLLVLMITVPVVGESSIDKRYSPNFMASLSARLDDLSAQQRADLQVQIANEFGLIACEVRSIAYLPVQDEFTVRTQLGDSAFDLTLYRHTLRSGYFTLLVDDGSLHPVEPPSVLTYRGWVDQDSDADVAASITANGQLHAMIFKEGGDTWFIEPIDKKVPGVPMDWHVFYRASDVKPTQSQHGVVEAEALGSRIADAANQTIAEGIPVGFTEIAFDADVEFFQLNASSVVDTTTDIEMLFNFVDLIYHAQLEICHTITGIIVRTVESDPYSATDSIGLLCEFTDFWNTNNPIAHDVAHLVTGKELDGSTTSIAWTGVICGQVFNISGVCPGLPNGTLDYSLSESLFQSPSETTLSFRIVNTARPLGNNWNACFCNQSVCTGGGTDADCGIMRSTPHANLTFGARAVSDITAHRDSRTCLDTCGTSPADCDGDGIPDEVELAVFDCNSNGLVDDCETDCNNSGRPDDCDIDANTSQDCNLNVIPDECEQDCSGNGFPDDCDPTRVFVDASATGGNNGINWANAYVSLELALAANICNGGLFTEIWVANGTYMPDGGYTLAGGSHVPGTGDRTATFQLMNGVTIYGGFGGGDSVAVPGGETSLSERPTDPDPSTVDPLTDSILSGDLVGNDGPGPFDNNNDNAFHVVNGTGTDATSAIDSFSITGGNADVSALTSLGGGMLNNPGSPNIRNCIFINNSAVDGGGLANLQGSSSTMKNCLCVENRADDNGGGMNNFQSNPAIVDCAFLGNEASNGGGVYGFASTSTLINCIFSGNTATSGIGGGIFNDNSNSTVTNSTFSGNTVLAGSGGGMGNGNNSDPTVINCILWGNSPDEIFNSDSGVDNPNVSFSDVQGGLSAGIVDGGGNINIDPLFIDPDGADNIVGTGDDDLKLGSGSPCIDAADNTAVPPDVTDLDDDADTTERTPLDLDGSPRFTDVSSVTDTGVADPPNYPDVVDMGAYEALGIEPPDSLTGEPGFDKDRYVSFGPNTNATSAVATRVTRVGSTTDKYVDCTSLQDKGADGWYATLIDGPLPAPPNSTYYCDLSSVITGLHVRGCSVVPGNSYDVAMTTDGSSFSAALSIPTTPPAPPRNFGDTVGSFVAGNWTAPEGIVTTNDIVAAVKKFGLDPDAALLARLDTEGSVPNAVMSSGDILRAVRAFAGDFFGSGVTGCATGMCVPPQAGGCE